jgi:hypothetical protein
MGGNTLKTQKEAAYYAGWCHMDAGASTVMIVRRSDDDYFVATRKDAKALREALAGQTSEGDRQAIMDGFLDANQRRIREIRVFKDASTDRPDVTIADILQQLAEGFTRLAERRRQAEED